MIWNLCALANATGIDMTEAAVAKMRVNAGRAWPQEPITNGTYPGREGAR